MRKSALFFLLFIFFLGLAFRLIYFKEAYFGWDQARDMLQAAKIWHGDPIKLIGPSTAELPGLHHGSFYWYLISPILFFTQGNAYAVRFFLILLNLSGVFILFSFVKSLIKNEKIALLSSFLFAVSFEAVQYGRWLSNPAPALITILLTFYGLWLMLNKNKIGVPLTLISWALSIHFQFFLIYQGFFILPLFIYLLKKGEIKWGKEMLIGILGLVGILLPFAVAELKFNFQGLKAFSSLSNDGGFNLLEILSKYFDRLTLSFQYNFLGINRFFSILLTLFVIGGSFLYSRKNKNRLEIKFLLLWILSVFIVFLFNKAGAYFVTIGIIYPIIILTVYLLFEISKKLKFQNFLLAVFVLLITASSLNAISRENKKGETLFAIQNNLILSDELKILDYVYQDAGKKPFVINTITNPLFINTTWAYLFGWHGKSNYGYLPIWSGYPQTGQFGEEVQFGNQVKIQSLPFYLITEPTPGIPEIYIAAISEYENTRSKLISVKKFGGFTVQKRVLFNNNNFNRDKVLEIINN